MSVCKKCGNTLCNDEIAIYKRMVNRGATDFLCIHCFAEYFGVTESFVREKIDYFRAQGCTLFISEESEKK